MLEVTDIGVLAMSALRHRRDDDSRADRDRNWDLAAQFIMPASTTFVGARVNGRRAPIPAVRLSTIDRVKST